MPMYQVNFVYNAPMFGNVDLEASNADQAEEFGMEAVEELYPEAEDIEIIAVKEINH